MAFSPPVLGYLVKKGLQKGGSRAPQDAPRLRPCITMFSVAFARDDAVFSYANAAIAPLERDN